MARTKQMKRLMMLGALLLIFALVGCNNVPQMSTPTTSTEPPVTPPVTPPEEPIEIVRGAPFALNDDLVAYLTHYLKYFYTSFEPTLFSRTMEGNLDAIKNDGERAIFGTFDPDVYSFACAYYQSNDGHKESHYCCRDYYTWVGFAKETDISELYNGDKLVAAFQINEAVSCDELTAEGEDSFRFGYYQPYTSKFKDGYNTESCYPTPLQDGLVHITSSTTKNVYFCRYDAYWFDRATDCVAIDGQYYLKLYQRKESWDAQTVVAEDWERKFGVYYELLTDMMLDNQLSEPEGTEDGHYSYMYYYSLIDIENFTSLIKSIKPIKGEG